MRRARIIKSPSTTREIVARYLPANYEVEREDDEHVYIIGEDSHGWTLDDYVLPRLASGLHFGHEITEQRTEN